MKLEELATNGARILNKYRRAPETERTALLRELATTLVDARSYFITADGSPDMKGRTWAYRQFVNDLYLEAGLSKEERLPIQAAVRYHVGEVVRGRLSPEELEDLGLQERSPKEAVRARRATNSAILSALTQKDFQGGALLSLTTASRVLAGIDEDALLALDPEARAVAESTLRDMRRRADRILRRMDPPTSRRR